MTYETSNFTSPLNFFILNLDNGRFDPKEIFAKICRISKKNLNKIGECSANRLLSDFIGLLLIKKICKPCIGELGQRTH